MGIPAENFVEPEKISRQFFCAICTDVVSDPVETCYGHLFCKDEILIWLEKSSKCPITQQSLTKGQLKAPGLLLQSMLKDLVMNCSNRCYGCNWKGPQSNVQDHSVRCLEVLYGQHLGALREKDGEIARLGSQLEREKELGTLGASLRAKLRSTAYTLNLFMKLVFMTWLVQRVAGVMPAFMKTYLTYVCWAMQLGCVALFLITYIRLL